MHIDKCSYKVGNKGNGSLHIDIGVLSKLLLCFSEQRIFIPSWGEEHNIYDHFIYVVYSEFSVWGFV